LEKRNLGRTRKLLRLKILNFQPPVQGACLDISSTGMKIRMRSKRHLDTSKLLDIEVFGKEDTYNIKGAVCWSKRTVLERVIGIRFVDVPIIFLRDVLHLDPGTQGIPYILDFTNNDLGRAEFFANLKFGGIVIKDVINSESLYLPDLHQTVHVKVIQDSFRAPVQFTGEVVAHLPNGIGLRIDDFHNLYEKLTKN